MFSRLLLASPVMGLLLIGLPSGAWAQDQAAAGQTTAPGQGAEAVVAPAGGPEQLQEVTVTASRRSEAELDVPMSVTVLGAQQLQQATIRDFNDFAVQVPTVNFDYSQGGNVNNRGVAIRGIEGPNTTGFYLDDLPMPISLDPRVVDLDRIEVLEGPQGTLYGARSMGGTIREITTAPNLNKYSAIVDGQLTSLDGGSNGYLGYVTANIPLVSDTLALRVTPYRGQDGGWITRAWPVPGYTPGAAPPGVQDSTVYDCQCSPGRVSDTAQTGYEGLNGQLLWRPISNLAIRPKFLYQKSSQNGLPLGNYSAENTTNYMHFDIPEGTINEFMFYGGTIDYTTPVGTITSATSGFDQHVRDYEDPSEFQSFGFGTPLLPVPTAIFNNIHDITEELRFASTWSFPLQVTAGLYYEKNDGSEGFNQYAPGFSTAPSLFLGGASWDTDTVAALWGPTQTWSKAVYAELTYKLTDKWTLILGERYSEDSYEAGGKLWGAIAFPGTTFAASTYSLVSSESDTILTPRYVVQYQASPNLNLYADMAKGFRPGGGQAPPGLNICAADYAAAGLTPADLAKYNPDYVWNYEVGEKAFFDDHKYSVNASAYLINWIGIQQYMIFQCGEGGIVNSGRAVSKGGELQVAAVPFHGLTLNAGIGYDYSRITEAGALVSVPPAGDPVQEVAPLRANAAGDYTHALTADMSWDLHLDWNYTSHRFSDANSPNFPRLIPAYFLLNSRFTITRGAGEYSLFVKNMGGIHPNLSDQLSNAAEDPGRPRWEEGPPTTYGLEARYTF
jgi:outer membrane receptor protein involved in Fe transport